MVQCTRLESVRAKALAGSNPASSAFQDVVVVKQVFYLLYQSFLPVRKIHFLFKYFYLLSNVINDLRLRS